MKEQDQSRQCLANVTWTKAGKRLLAEFTSYMNSHVDSDYWDNEIEAAIEDLRFFPLRCAVICVRGGLQIRRLIVGEYALVYYVYFSSRTPGDRGRISVRGVSHAARRNPLSGIREKDGDVFDSCFGWQLRDGDRWDMDVARHPERIGLVSTDDEAVTSHALC